MAVRVESVFPNGEDEYGPIPPREAVITDDLRPLLHEYEAQFREGWRGLHPSEPEHNCPVWKQLAFNAGVPERRVYGIVHGETAMTDLDIADRLCIALGKHISHVPVHTEKELRDASREQGEILRLIVRCRGGHIPTGREPSNLEIPRWKRKLYREGQCR